MTRFAKAGFLVLLQITAAEAYADNKVEPQVTGTLRSFLNQPAEIAPVGNEIQSLITSSEVRRGIAEFIIPALPGHVTRATLVLTENRGVAGNPLPPDTHLLSFYEGNLALDPADFDGPTTAIATFMTDSNDQPTVIRLDITAAVQSLEGKVLGLRVEKVDGDINSGTVFQNTGPDSPIIEIRRGLGPKN